ncbi:MAG: hypothetical protein GF313_16940 [Caldithrix sp.]|nr:hypothetical protein [Caldithrix sp.]
MKYVTWMLNIFTSLIVMTCSGSGKLQHSDNSQNQSEVLDTQLNHLTGQIVQELLQTRTSKIAVVEFSDLENNVNQLGRFLAEELITRLFRTRTFEVIERQMLHKVMEENRLTLSGIVDATSAKELGRILGVDAIATGSITDLGHSIKVNARLISTETGKVFSVASVNLIKNNTVKKLLGEPIDGQTKIPTPSVRIPPKEKPTPQMVVKKEGFSIVLQECTLSNGQITCTLLVSNTTEQDKKFAITYGWQYQTKIFDELGNEYLISAVQFADDYQKIKGLSQYSGARKKIIAGQSVQTKLYFDNVSSETDRIALLQILCGYRGFKVEFRNINLINQ